MHRARPRQREAVALCVSLAAHAALAWALLRRTPRTPPPAPRAAPLEVVLLPPPPPARRAPPPDAPPPLASPAVTHLRGGAPARSRSAPAPRGAAPAGPTPAADAGAPAPGSAAWAEAEGLGVPVAPGAPPSLDARLPRSTPGAPAGDATGDAALPRGDPSAPEPAVAVAARAQGTLTDAFAELAAVERTRFPDAYWMRVRDAIGGELQVPWDTLSRDDPDGTALGGSRLGQAAAGLLQWDPRRSGSAPGQAQPRLSPSARDGLDAPQRESRLLVAELVTWVELTQAADGSVVRFHLVQTSGSVAYDDLVLARFAALGAEAVAALGTPPPSGRRSRWAVATRFELAPPAPVVGCAFDAVFRPGGCVYPLKRFIRTRVDLERLRE